MRCISILLALAFSVVSSLLGCASSPTVPDKEAVWQKVVMGPGMRINADTNNGSVSIMYERDTIRTYAFGFGGKTIRKTLVLGKRAREGNGLTGLYGGAGVYTPAFLVDADPVAAVVQEGQMHRSDNEECLAWMNAETHAVWPWVYNDSGRAVRFQPLPSGDRVRIEVVQFYVAGEKPKGLRGAMNSGLRVSYADQQK
jgi:hypothetical protein